MKAHIKERRIFINETEGSEDSFEQHFDSNQKTEIRSDPNLTTSGHSCSSDAAFDFTSQFKESLISV